jgi:putative intracellular protease/amidase
MRTVHVAIYDTLADWEYGYAVARIHNPEWQKKPGAYQVKTVALKKEPVTTMGGIHIVPDGLLSDLRAADSALLIVPGASLWDQGGLGEVATAAKKLHRAGLPIAAICGGTFGLSSTGMFDDIRHTSSARQYLERNPGYHGAKNYVEADAVTDSNVITAGPTEPIAFAREIFKLLDLFEPAVLEAWFKLFKSSDASAFGVLAKAGSAG